MITTPSCNIVLGFHKGACYIRETSASRFAQQPEESPIQVIVDVLRTWDVGLRFQVIIGESLGHCFENIRMEVRISFAGHSFQQFHPIRVEQFGFGTPSGRVADSIRPGSESRVTRALVQAVQGYVSFSPTRILETEVLQLIVTVPLDPVLVLAG
jgi:hypothetical protein